MTVTVVDHPLARHLLTELRDRTTPPTRFRALTKRLTAILVLEATRDLPTDDKSVETPLERTEGSELPGIVAVPILRAGLGMVEAVTELFPGVGLGHIGLERDELTLQPLRITRSSLPWRDDMFSSSIRCSRPVVRRCARPAASRRKSVATGPTWFPSRGVLNLRSNWLGEDHLP